MVMVSYDDGLMVVVFFQNRTLVPQFELLRQIYYCKTFFSLILLENKYVSGIVVQLLMSRKEKEIFMN